MLFGEIDDNEAIVSSKRDRAIALMNSADYEAAYKLFSEIGEHDKIASSKYNRARVLIDSGDYKEAYVLLDGLNYKDSDDLLESISTNIFAHVFSHSLKQESTHDFSSDSLFEYKHLFTHIFYHLRDDKELIKTILSSSCREVFLEELRKGIGPLVEKVVKDGIVPYDDIPLPLAILQTRERFVISFVYWFGNDCKESPETMTSYLFSK